ncbi:hypothetical protein [Nocardioides sp.]|uniref:hypothetical protein n=1 Tax=Nocardioides sp. TaxID=35761 RepID=UPI0035B1AE3F
MTDPLAILVRDGKKVDALTDGALKRAEKILGYSLTIVQGSYNPGKVRASGGTHDKGGTVDLMPWDRENKVRALRAVGFAAWFRPAIPGLWSAHIHAVLIGHPDLAPTAAAQTTAYLNHRDGLKGNGPDLDPGWVGNVRYTVQALRNDQHRAALEARIAAQRADLERARAEARSIRGRLKKLRDKLKGLSQ